MSKVRLGFVLSLVVFALGCGYRYFADPLKPLPEVQQAPKMTVSDDGTVTYVHERLEIGLRPLTDDELDRQFPRASESGAKSTNPYTYGNWRAWGAEWTPSRFTVFLLRVKNYTYPKMQIDPLKAVILTRNGRRYEALSLVELQEHYYPYAVGYAGDSYKRFQERSDILRSTLYRDEVIFSGQEIEGYIVFPNLYPDVEDLSVQLKDVVLRLDFLGEPLEAVDLTFLFERDTYRAHKPRDQ